MKHILETDVPELWSKIEPFVERCLLKTKRNKQYPSWWVEDKLLDGYLQCWVNDDFDVVIITMLHTFPSGYKALEIWLVCGTKIDEWLDSFFNTMKHFAKINGCSEIFASGRSGWQRKLKELSKGSFHQESMMHLEI